MTLIYRGDGEEPPPLGSQTRSYSEGDMSARRPSVTDDEAEALKRRIAELEKKLRDNPNVEPDTDAAQEARKEYIDKLTVVLDMRRNKKAFAGQVRP